MPDLTTVVVPVGGGGMISGIATVVKAQRPNVRVIGVEAAASPGARESLPSGK
ncbi:MAG: pyridoxal-phosphate dependent enzyme, partial [Gemmatimonadales bacterium]|nr:pyridoxal-phosphate dependent enzyme [Gemmatimonadales bacterium]